MCLSRKILYQYFVGFMLGCRLSFKAYVKDVRENATKCSLKTSDILLGADGHVLT